MSSEKKKELTEQQKLFLQHLSNPENKGNLRLCMELAGFSKHTPIIYVIRQLKDEIIEVAKELMAAASIQATMSVIGVMTDPKALESRTVLSAAKEVLDRAGVVKQEDSAINVPKGGVVLLPAKKVDDYILVSNKEYEGEDE